MLSILSDDDVESAACRWLLDEKPETRTMTRLKSHLDNVIIPDLTGIQGNIAEPYEDT